MLERSLTAAQVLTKTGVVDFFNLEKGYGFVVPDDGGPNIFLHITVVKKSAINCRYLGPGVRLNYVEVEGNNERLAIGYICPPTVVGKVKFFTQSKGYGFFVLESGIKDDIFFHVQELKQSRIETEIIPPGTRMSFWVGCRDGKLLATDIFWL